MPQRALQANIDVITCCYTDFDILDIKGQLLQRYQICQQFLIHLEPQNYLHGKADC